MSDKIPKKETQEMNSFQQELDSQSIQNQQKQHEMQCFGQSLTPNALLRSKWTQQQRQALVQLYLQHGPKWNYFKTKLQNRCYRQIKNKFNNSIKRIARILFIQEGHLYKNTKRSITVNMLKTMIDFVNQLQKSIQQLDLTPNYESRLFSFRQQLLKVSIILKCPQNQLPILNNLIRLIKSLNSKISCFGFFRRNSNKKSPQLTISSLLSILEFDQVILQNMTEIMLKLKIFNNKEDRQQKVTQLISNFGQLGSRNICLEQVEGFDDQCFNRQTLDLERKYPDIFGEPIFDLQEQDYTLL